VATLDQHFAPPATFNALQHLRESIASLPRRFAAQILLRTDLSSARAHLLEPMGLLEQSERGVMFYNQADDLAWLARQLAALPFSFEIVHPAQLRHEVKKLARRLLDNAEN
jgi:predicted DNA-binding transcriptional regulator YafY